MNYKLYNGDCLEQLDNVENKSIQTILIDPPYNIKKDTWDDIPNYNEWMLNVIEKLLMKMKDNGSFFMFHNDMPIISRLMVGIEQRFPRLKFKQMIVWNKRFNESKKKGFLDGFIVRKHLTNWNKMAEYILFYTFDNSYKIKPRRMELKIKALDISKEILSKNGNLTGWYSNIETGKNFPTRETMKPITKHLGLEFEDIVPKYYNLRTHHSVWNYDMAKRCKIHVTPKPLDLLKNIILHTTDEGDKILDCFGGSGTTAYASLETNRYPIIIERDPKYFSYIKNTIEEKYHKKGIPEIVEEIVEKIIKEIIEEQPSEEIEEIAEELTEEEQSSEEIDYSKMKVSELKKECKNQKIKGYSKLKKKALIQLLKK